MLSVAFTFTVFQRKSRRKCWLKCPHSIQVFLPQSANRENIPRGGQSAGADLTSETDPFLILYSLCTQTMHGEHDLLTPELCVESEVLPSRELLPLSRVAIGVVWCGSGGI